MATKCVVCGKEYARDVTGAHLKSHKMSRKKYDALVAQLPQEAWDFYWLDMNNYLRRLFPDPIEGGPTNKNHPLCQHGITSFKKFVRQYAYKYKLEACLDSLQ